MNKSMIALSASAVMLMSCSSAVREIANEPSAQLSQPTSDYLKLEWENDGKNEQSVSDALGVVHLPQDLPPNVRFELNCEECKFDGIVPDLELKIFLGIDSLDVAATELKNENTKVTGVIPDLASYFEGNDSVKRNLEVTLRPNPEQTWVKRFDLKKPPSGLDFSISTFKDVSTLNGTPSKFNVTQLTHGLAKLSLVVVLSYKNNRDEPMTIEFPEPSVEKLTEEFVYSRVLQGHCQAQQSLIQNDKTVTGGEYYYLPIDSNLNERVREISVANYERPASFRAELAPGEEYHLGIYVLGSPLNYWTREGYTFESPGVGRFVVRCEERHSGKNLKMDPITWIEEIWGELPIGDKGLGLTLNLSESNLKVQVRSPGSVFSRPFQLNSPSIRLF